AGNQLQLKGVRIELEEASWGSVDDEKLTFMIVQISRPTEHAIKAGELRRNSRDRVLFVDLLIAQKEDPAIGRSHQRIALQRLIVSGELSHPRFRIHTVWNRHRMDQQAATGLQIKCMGKKVEAHVIRKAHPSGFNRAG